MSSLLIALLGVLVLPLFVGTWRTSLFGLSCQGLLMAWLAYLQASDMSSASAWLTLFDLAVVRGVWAPLALYGVLRAQNAPPRNDVIPPNLLSWTLALVAVIVAFEFSAALVVEEGPEQTLVAVASGGILLGFLVLATKASPFSQMVGALRIENAIALFELGGGHPVPVGVQLAQTALVALTIALYRWYLQGFGGKDAGKSGEVSLEQPTL